METATDQRIAKAGKGGVETTVRGQRITEAPLDRLHSLGAITNREYEGGNRYRIDAFLAKIEPGAPSVDWGAIASVFGPRTPSAFSSQAIADARLRHRKTARAFDSIVHTIADLALIKEVGLIEIGRSVFGRSDGREASVAGQAGLRVALGALADYYERA